MCCFRRRRRRGCCGFGFDGRGFDRFDGRCGREDRRDECCERRCCREDGEIERLLLVDRCEVPMRVYRFNEGCR